MGVVVKTRTRPSCHSPPFGRHSMAIPNEIPCVSARARVRRCRCELDLRHRPLASRKKTVRGRWLGRSKWPIIGLWRSLCAVRALTNSEKKGPIYDVIMHICDVSGGRSIPRGRELIAQRLTGGLFCKSQGSPPALANWVKSASTPEQHVARLHNYFVLG